MNDVIEVKKLNKKVNILPQLSETKMAKFKLTLKDHNQENMYLLVSLENERQSGENLAAFFDLIFSRSKYLH